MSMSRNLRILAAICAALIGAVALITLAACNRVPKLNEQDGYAEGTTYHITWWSPQPVDSTAVSQDVMKALREIDEEISSYRPDSILQGFNHSRSTAWQPLPASTIKLLEIAQPVYRDSNGCYDPTVGPLFDLWGFRDKKTHIPTQQQIDKVKKEIGFDHLQIDAAHNKVRKTVRQLDIDLSSVGEGYTIWRLSRVLEHYGVHDYIVEFGGDMLVKGHKPGGAKWRVAIARPVAGKRTATDILAIENENGVSINTSGTYRRFFDANGKSYSHILDPRTGRPVTHNLVSATVIDTDPRVGDAWATAMLCMGRKEGDAVAKTIGLKVYFIQDENGRLAGTESPALRNSGDVTISAGQ